MAQGRLQSQRSLLIAQAALVWELPDAGGQINFVTFGSLGDDGGGVVPFNERIFEGLQKAWENQ